MNPATTASCKSPAGSSHAVIQETMPPARDSPGQNGVIWTLWLTYGAFYFCRTNISAAVPGLKGSIESGGLGLSAAEVGWILASLKIAYGLGQFFNGQLSERFSPRIMLAIGMFGSAALNVLFGLSTGFYFLLFVWAANGFCQSLGWTPCIRVVANWIPVVRRGHAIGIIGTGYQITLGLTYLIAGQASKHFGWQGALYVPAALLALTGLFMLIFLRESPSTPDCRPPAPDSRLSTPDSDPLPLSPSPAPFSIFEILLLTLTNPALWILGLSLGLLNACRYGFLDWGVTHLMETKELKVDKATLQFFVIALGAAAGSYLAGWATDRFFSSRRAPVICVLLAILGVLAFIYGAEAGHGTAVTMALLVVIGFCIYGPQVLLVGTAPADLARRGTSAAAAGFVNFLGYMGAASGDVITGYFASPKLVINLPVIGTLTGGWQTVIYIWAAWAFAAALLMALLWKKKGER
jgi:sugar phosphate permease